MSDDIDSDRRRYAERALACLDLTSLNLDDTPEVIDVLCGRALSPAPGIDIRPAAVCVYERFVAQCAERLRDTGIKVAAVANFPLGTASTDEVISEVQRALDDGADEIDVVLPFRDFVAGNTAGAAEMIGLVSTLCHSRSHSAALKVILETGVLQETSTIKSAARVAVAYGADFLKTSTGKLEPAATPEAAAALLDVIAETATDGRAIGLKVAGGVKPVDDAAVYLDLADRTLPGGAVPSNFRFGASGLLNDLVRVLGGAHSIHMSADY